MKLKGSDTRLRVDSIHQLERADLELVVRAIILATDPSSDQIINQRRRALLSRAADIIHADFWFWMTGEQPLDSNSNANLAIPVSGGSTDDISRLALCEFIANPEQFAQVLDVFQDCFVDNQYRSQLLSLEGPTDLPTTLKSSFPHRIHSLYPIQDRRFSYLLFCRSSDQHSFTRREQEIIDLIFSAMDWLHRDIPTLNFETAIVGLTDRQREVLECLLDGESTKAIANRLSLSHHTIGDYIKFLYKQFNVNSRSELLAKFIAK